MNFVLRSAALQQTQHFVLLAWLSGLYAQSFLRILSPIGGIVVKLRVLQLFQVEFGWLATLCKDIPQVAIIVVCCSLQKTSGTILQGKSCKDKTGQQLQALQLS